MPLFGTLVVIKRNGTDGARFPLVQHHCTFGSAPDSDIRIQLPDVAKEHCTLSVNATGEVSLKTSTEGGAVFLEDERIQFGIPHTLNDKQTFTICDRSFRFEYSSKTPHKRMMSSGAARVATPGKRPAMEFTFASAQKSAKKTPSRAMTAVLPSSQGRVKKPPSPTKKGSTPKKKTPSPKKVISTPIRKVDAGGSRTPLSSSAKKAPTPKQHSCLPKGSPPKMKRVMSPGSVQILEKKKKLGRFTPSPAMMSTMGKGIPGSPLVPARKSLHDDITQLRRKSMPVKETSGSPALSTSFEISPPAPAKKSPRKSSPKASGVASPRQPVMQKMPSPGAADKADHDDSIVNTTPEKWSPSKRTPTGRRASQTQSKKATPSPKKSSPGKSPTEAVKSGSPATGSKSPKKQSPSPKKKTPSPKRQSPSPLKRSSPKRTPVKSPKVMNKSALDMVLPTPADTPIQITGVKRKRTLLDSVQSEAKRKRVSYGPNLSPELFDKRLPPATPLKKGNVPTARQSTSKAISPSPRRSHDSSSSPWKTNAVGESAAVAGSPIAHQSPSKSPAKKGKSPRKSPKATPKISQTPKKVSPKASLSPSSPVHPQTPVSQPTPGPSGSRVLLVWGVIQESEGSELKVTSRGSTVTPLSTNSPKALSSALKQARSALESRVPASRASLPATNISVNVDDVQKGAKATIEKSESPKKAKSLPTTPVKRTENTLVNALLLDESSESASKKMPAKLPKKTPAKSPKKTPAKSPKKSPKKTAVKSPKRRSSKASSSEKLASSSEPFPVQKVGKSDEPNKSTAVVSSSPESSGEDRKSASPASAKKGKSVAKSPRKSTPRKSPAKPASTPKNLLLVSSAMPHGLTSPPLNILDRKSAQKRMSPVKAAQQQHADSDQLRKSAIFRSHLMKSAKEALQPTIENPAVPMLWADVVKKGKPTKAPTPKKAAKRISAKLFKKAKLQSTQRAISSRFDTIARDVQSTGHALSPATFVVRPKAVPQSRRSSSTPKGRAKLPAATTSGPTDAEPVEVSFVGLKELFATPSPIPHRSPARASSGRAIKPSQRLQDAYKSGYSPDLRGLKGLLKTPKPRKSVASPKLAGIRGLLRTPKADSGPSPKLQGVRKLLKTPKDKPTTSPKLSGVKRLLASPKEKPVQTSPKFEGLKRMLKSPKEPKPKSPKSPDFTGLKRLMNSPKAPRQTKDQSSPQLQGLHTLMKTPEQRVNELELSEGILNFISAPPVKLSPAKRSTKKATKSAVKASPRKTRARKQTKEPPVSPTVSGRRGRKATTKAAVPANVTHDADTDKAAKEDMVVPLPTVSPVATRRGKRVAKTTVKVLSPRRETETTDSSPKPSKAKSKAEKKVKTPSKVEGSITVSPAQPKTRAKKGVKANVESKAQKEVTGSPKVAKPRVRRGKAAARAKDVSPAKTSEPTAKVAERLPEKVTNSRQPPEKQAAEKPVSPRKAQKTVVSPKVLKSPPLAKRRARRGQPAVDEQAGAIQVQEEPPAKKIAKQSKKTPSAEAKASIEPATEPKRKRAKVSTSKEVTVVSEPVDVEKPQRASSRRGKKDQTPTDALALPTESTPKKRPTKEKKTDANEQKATAKVSKSKKKTTIKATPKKKSSRNKTDSPKTKVSKTPGLAPIMEVSSEFSLETSAAHMTLIKTPKVTRGRKGRAAAGKPETPAKAAKKSKKAVKTGSKDLGDAAKKEKAATSKRGKRKADETMPSAEPKQAKVTEIQASEPSRNRSRAQKKQTQPAITKASPRVTRRRAK